MKGNLTTTRAQKEKEPARFCFQSHGIRNPMPPGDLFTLGGQIPTKLLRDAVSLDSRRCVSSIYILRAVFEAQSPCHAYLSFVLGLRTTIWPRSGIASDATWLPLRVSSLDMGRMRTTTFTVSIGFDMV